MQVVKCSLTTASNSKKQTVMLTNLATKSIASFVRVGFSGRNLQARLSSNVPLSASAIIDAHTAHVMPTYGRFELALSHGEGSYLFDVDGNRYLDAAGGIAVNCLGHAHPALSGAIATQASRLIHCSNLYYTEQQGRLEESSAGAPHTTRRVYHSRTSYTAACTQEKFMMG